MSNGSGLGVTPFILSGSGRSGSSLLEHSLKQHPQIRMYGELLKNNSRFQIDGRRYLKGEDGASFLQYVFSTRYSGEVGGVGFKFFYNHAREDPSATTVWRFIAENREVRIIWIKRNWFAQLVSLVAATQSGVWWVQNRPGEDPPEVPPFDLTMQRCERYFSNREKWTRQLTTEIQGHAVLKIEYDDLCSSYFETIQDALDFLELSRIITVMPTKKQRLLEPHQQVLNYSELKSYFTGTRYEVLFRVGESLSGSPMKNRVFGLA